MVYSKFSNYLSNNKTQPKESHTHTRIGDKKKIYGGSFHIKNQEEFYDNYYNHVFENNEKEYLTEKQLPNGQILIDLDFRYANEIKTRQHNNEHYESIIDLYVDKLKEIYDIPYDKKFPVFVLEKPNVNCLKDKTKDGIHIILGISSTAEEQLYLRKKVIEDINYVLDDLPLQNNYEDVFDIGITKKTTNWQMFGSQKPHNEKYELVAYYDLFVNDDDLLERHVNDLLNINVKEILPIISARNTDIVKFDLKIEIPKEIKIKKNKVVKNRIIKKKKINDFENITSKEILDEMIDLILIDANEKSYYHIQEAYDYTMALSNKFYEPYDKWIDIGWTLRCIDDILFPVWIKFSTQSKEFSFDKVAEFYELWENMKDKGKTVGTLIYYLKDDNWNKYKKIKKKQMSYYINEACKTETEYDLAICLYHATFEDFIYSEADGFLYHWNGTYWEKSKEKNKCCTISHLISNRLYGFFCFTEADLLQRMIKIVDEKEREKAQNYISKVSEMRIRLRKTNWKKNIETEFRAIIQQKHSVKQEDMNKELGGLVFQNGVIDFIGGVHFAKGGKTKHNYNTFCLPYDYIPYNKEKHKEQSQVLKTFMKQIFVNNESRKFMWELMASSIVGKHKQKFIILKGTGGNGKGVLMNLWSAVLGDYYYKAKADVLVDHSVDVRGSNVELAGMNFKRLIMYNELPKRKKFNCAKIKLLTGDKYIKARFNHSNNSKVIQYGLHICDCNFFPFMDEEDTEGNAIRRRLRVVQCESTFCDNPSDDGEKMEFERDDYMGSQEFADKYKAIMMSMLIEIVKRTHWEVKDCETVMKWTEDYYKKSSDIEEFFKSIIKEKVNNNFGYMKMVSFKDLYSAFRDSPIYSTLTKYEKKKYNKSKLIEICKNRYKGSILLRSRANNFNNKSIEKARTLCGYSNRFNGLVGYYVYNEEDDDDSDGEEQVYNNI